MSEIAIHEHEMGGIIIAWPTSVLDCEEPACRSRADMAQRGTYYELDYIQSRVALAHQEITVAMKHVEFWNLILEAKQRSMDVDQ